MGKHDLVILKFLADNPQLGPSILELMKRFSIPVGEIGPTLDSLFNRHMVKMKVDHQGIERWYPASGAQSVQQAPIVAQGAEWTSAPTPLAKTEGPPVSDSPRPEPTVFAEPASELPSKLAPVSRGVNWLVFFTGLLAMGGVAAWVGGRFLARDTVATAVKTKLEAGAFNAALRIWNDSTMKSAARLSALEAKNKETAKSLDSLRTVKAQLKKMEKTVDSLRSAVVELKKPVKPARRKR